MNNHPHFDPNNPYQQQQQMMQDMQMYRRGRNLMIFQIVFEAFASVLLILMATTMYPFLPKNMVFGVVAISLVLVGVLLFFLYRGHNWARITLIVILGFSGLSSLSSGNFGPVVFIVIRVVLLVIKPASYYIQVRTAQRRNQQVAKHQQQMFGGQPPSQGGQAPYQPPYDGGQPPYQPPYGGEQPPYQPPSQGAPPSNPYGDSPNIYQPPTPPKPENSEKPQVSEIPYEDDELPPTEDK